MALKPSKVENPSSGFLGWLHGETHASGRKARAPDGGLCVSAVGNNRRRKMENQVNPTLTDQLSPFGFVITGSEALELPSGRITQVQKAELRLKPWNGNVDFDTYNHKPLIDSAGEPLFAELAMLRILERNGWQGVWADSYRRKFRVAMPDHGESVTLPPGAEKIYQEIKSRTGKRGGCWDVFAWKDKQFIFLELKRLSKDVVRENQLRWLEAALDSGFQPRAFLLIEWNLE